MGMYEYELGLLYSDHLPLPPSSVLLVTRLYQWLAIATSLSVNLSLEFNHFAFQLSFSYCEIASMIA